MREGGTGRGRPLPIAKAPHIGPTPRAGSRTGLKTQVKRHRLPHAYSLRHRRQHTGRALHLQRMAHAKTAVASAGRGIRPAQKAAAAPRTKDLVRVVLNRKAYRAQAIRGGQYEGGAHHGRIARTKETRGYIHRLPAHLPGVTLHIRRSPHLHTKLKRLTRAGRRGRPIRPPRLSIDYFNDRALGKTDGSSGRKKRRNASRIRNRIHYPVEARQGTRRKPEKFSENTRTNSIPSKLEGRSASLGR